MPHYDGPQIPPPPPIVHPLPGTDDADHTDDGQYKQAPRSSQAPDSPGWQSEYRSPQSFHKPPPPGYPDVHPASVRVPALEQGGNLVLLPTAQILCPAGVDLSQVFRAADGTCLWDTYTVNGHLYLQLPNHGYLCAHTVVDENHRWLGITAVQALANCGHSVNEFWRRTHELELWYQPDEGIPWARAHRRVRISAISEKHDKLRGFLPEAVRALLPFYVLCTKLPPATEAARNQGRLETQRLYDEGGLKAVADWAEALGKRRGVHGRIRDEDPYVP
jgi:hypothetical protein